MMDLNALANGANELFRQHGPWVAEKLAAAAVAIPVREAWEFVKKKLSSAGGQEAIQKVEAEPAKDRNWDTFRNHLLDALEADPAFRDGLFGLLGAHITQTVTQSSHGDHNVQIQIVDSPGAAAKL